MYIFREIFHLHFGKYRDAKALYDEAKEKNLMINPPGARLLTDFTGEGYRLIMELPFESLGAYEEELKKDLGDKQWQQWYEKFKPLVRYSEREVLKVVG